MLDPRYKGSKEGGAGFRRLHSSISSYYLRAMNTRTLILHGPGVARSALDESARRGRLLCRCGRVGASISGSTLTLLRAARRPHWENLLSASQTLTGCQSFVEEECGFVVPCLDIPPWLSLSERVICLLDLPEFRLRMGEARRRVAEPHAISVAAPRIAEIIDRTIVEAESHSR
jgi:hypothetical protein